MVSGIVNGAGTEDLVGAAAAGDSSAQEQLVQRYSNVVWGTVRRFRLREVDAQDAVQNTWVRMIEHLSSVRNRDRLPGWLVTTARRECLKILRQSHREAVGLHHDLLDRVDENSPTPERAAVDATMNDLLWTHVAQLPQRGRELVAVLVASDASRYADFASLAGMPVGSIGPMRM